MTDEQAHPYFAKVDFQCSHLYRIEYMTPSGELDLSPLSPYSISVGLPFSVMAGPIFVTYILPHEPDIDALLFLWENSLTAPRFSHARVTLLRSNMEIFKMYEILHMRPSDMGRITLDWSSNEPLTRKVAFAYESINTM